MGLGDILSSVGDAVLGESLSGKVGDALLSPAGFSAGLLGILQTIQTLGGEDPGKMTEHQAAQIALQQDQLEALQAQREVENQLAQQKLAAQIAAQLSGAAGNVRGAPELVVQSLMQSARQRQEQGALAQQAFNAIAQNVGAAVK